MTLAAALTITLAPTAEAKPRPDDLPAAVRHKIEKARHRTHACQRQLGLKLSPVSNKPVRGASVRLLSPHLAAPSPRRRAGSPPTGEGQIRRLVVTLLALNAILLFPPTAQPAPPRVKISAALYQARCANAWHAVRFYRARYNEHRHVTGASLAPPVEQAMNCRRLRVRAVYWRDAAKTNRKAVARWLEREYDWAAFMPRGSKEYRVASCETGYGNDPNWAHDSGTYVSAFGIYRDGYADDAHRAGNLSWDETKQQLGRIPTPLEQYQAMQSHRAAHGGWSGWGCRGA